MKVIIDTEVKQISIIGITEIEELNEFVSKHNLQDYVLSVYEPQTPFIPHNWELKPPFYPTCETTGKGIELKDYTVLTAYLPIL